MLIFDRCIADLLQHFAVILELVGLGLIISDLYIHRADRGLVLRHSIAGIFGSGPDRAARIIWGIRIAAVAVLMEIYQLLTIHLG